VCRVEELLLDSGAQLVGLGAEGIVETDRVEGGQRIAQPAAA
jgi:hypothetical protein